LTIDTNSIYTVTVGAGGNGATTAGSAGSTGSNSVFLSITSSGGGGGASNLTNGANGGSGGGANRNAPTNVGTGTANQGRNGGQGLAGTGEPSGGGGGANTVGTNASSQQGGNGGAGESSSITGSSVTYAGGGGGGCRNTGAGGSGGSGGGGAGRNDGTTAGGSGTANTGSGGGGSGGNGSTSGTGGAGGSGIVIISYAGSTQQMAGGTVTVSGGNVIHTFTSSGYLTPIVLTTNSLRFRSSASAYLNRTPASAGNRRTFTYSVWLKRGVLDASYNKYFFSAKPSPSVRDGMYFGTSQTLSVFANDGSSASLVTTQVFRDVSAWYHIVVAVDTTQATASDRVKIYVNGSQVTAFGTATYPAINYDWAFNNSVIHTISDDAANAPTGLYHFDGYMTEINFIDGQALTPFSFGTTSDLGVWQPIRYGGSYGTNGFYLKFTDTTNTTTLGYDSSPNSNNWTTNNISLTAGSTYDSMTDVPTLTSATAGNYCVMNPLDNGGVTLSNGNLTITGAGSVFKIARSTLGVSTGKWYCEFVITAEGAPSRIDFGLLGFPATLSGSLGDTSNGYTVYESSSNIYKYNNSTSTLLVSSGSLDVNDVQMLAYDADAGKLWFGKNGTWFASGDPVAGTNAAFTGVSGQTYFVAVQAYNTSDVGQINFGQRPFTYTPPTGFVRLNTFNLPTPTIGATAATLANEYFDASLWTGNGSTQTITNSGSMQPDFVWYKGRSTTFNHGLFDSIRGTLQRLSSNLTSAESTTAGSLTAFNSNGFSVGSDAGANQNTDTYVGWQWRASNATAVTNTNGTITSTVSASTTAGFSIVTYTGTGVNATVGHGLGATPSMVTVKCRSTAGESWHTYHVGLSSLANTVYLNGTAAQGSFPTCFNSMSTLNSTVFSLGTDGASNGSGRTYVAYCFAPIAGYSAFGSYTGNGSADGPFVFTGFRPRFVMFKRTDSSDDWVFLDIARNTYNVMISALFPNSSSSETSNGFYDSDCVSNGFKIRATNAVVNASSGTYIYMAFAESPFKYANAR